MKDVSILLDHILESSNRILNKTNSETFHTFATNQDLIDITIRNLEIIGEACRALPDDFKEKNDNIRWQRTIGLRNVLIHEYFQVDLGMLWNIIKDDLPIFIKQIQGLRNN